MKKSLYQHIRKITVVEMLLKCLNKCLLMENKKVIFIII